MKLELAVNKLATAETADKLSSQLTSHASIINQPYAVIDKLLTDIGNDGSTLATD